MKRMIRWSQVASNPNLHMSENETMEITQRTTSRIEKKISEALTTYHKETGNYHPETEWLARLITGFYMIETKETSYFFEIFDLTLRFPKDTVEKWEVKTRANDLCIDFFGTFPKIEERSTDYFPHQTVEHFNVRNPNQMIVGVVSITTDAEYYTVELQPNER